MEESKKARQKALLHLLHSSAMPRKNPRAPYSLEIMDDIRRVAPSKLGHRDIDLLIVVLDVNLDIFMQFQLPSERRIQRAVQNTPVEQPRLPSCWSDPRKQRMPRGISQRVSRKVNCLRVLTFCSWAVPQT
uniref:Uncharacterized protein n=1 Tax=Meleagris gallopavo TaxID=9103 RepID=A0A803XSK3_MELGA